MKKILILILNILFIILIFFLIFKNVSIGNWCSKSIENIKNLSKNLEGKMEEAKKDSKQGYPNAISRLESAIKNLEIAKQKYENINSYTEGDVELGIVQIEEYKIERLWIALENYAKDEEIDLKLDLLETSTLGIYDLDITLEGSYMGITDFIYDIEKDDTLGFQISNFKLVPNVKEQRDGNGKVVKTQNLKATFKVEDVRINLD